ncbi:MAG TPA: DUF1588 domain-containing protein [Polyangia bacterium]|jgi:hypothetical protein|nr:DUF1588 domain-containing protein [Polyangia bacterium]
MTASVAGAQVRFAALAALAAALAGGCTGTLEGAPVTPGAGAIGGGAGAGGAGGQAATTATGTPTVDMLAASCTSTQLAPPMLRRLGAREYAATVGAAFAPLVTAGVDLASLVSISDDTLSKLRLGNDASVLLVGNQTAQQVMASAEAVAATVTSADHLPQVLPCATTSPDETCATTFVNTIGAALFRRPLQADETGRYVGAYRSIVPRADFPAAIKWTLSAMLQSPAMLYRSEIGAKQGSGYQLSPSEIASALAYDFGGGPPSAALLAQAQSGALADPTQRVAAAKQLLLTSDGRQSLQQFFRQWGLYTRVITETRAVGSFDFDTVRQAMTDETQRFIDEVVVNRKGGVKDLLTAAVTVLNPTLAQYYAYGSPGADWTVVDRPAQSSVGFLAQGSLLAGNAHPDSSSPTLRGLVVFERLLCNTRPLPPPNVPQIAPVAPGVKTTRQRYEEQHAAGGACQACHIHFDPIGFGFEHFDQTGRYRADDGGLPINAADTARAPDGTTLFSFDGLTDLSQKLAALPQVSSCVGGYAEAYVFGGGGGQSCLAVEQRQALVQGQTGLLDFVASLAAAPSFLQRRAP